MAKESMKARERKRAKIVAKYGKKTYVPKKLKKYNKRKVSGGVN